MIQQGNQINGVVIDKKGEPIIGANIMEKGHRMVLLLILMVNSH